MNGIHALRCRQLVLDAGPLLSLSPLRGLAEAYYAVPQVLNELKDPRARENFQRLSTTMGVRIEIKEADAAALSHVIEFAKKTGDFAVLSYADLCTLALTYTLHVKAKEAGDARRSEQTPIFDDPSDDDDGEGDWITPSNADMHKSRALNLLPCNDDKDRRKDKHNDILQTGCMTADFAMQNMLLQMGLNLVSADAKKIEKVKTWVLRCHACFQICKDNSKSFCPSCGNPTLLRASVTISSPGTSSTSPTMTVHLKKHFQYRTRGNIYSIPSPKPGSAKGGPSEGLILREDQAEWIRATKKVEGKRVKEEKKIMKRLVGKGDSVENRTAGLGNWMDPDWTPEIMSASAGGKGRTIRSGADGYGMPVIGFGKRNPNERRKQKR